MVELQSCAGLVNDSALCAIGQEVEGGSVNVIAEISAELQRERQRNAELLERVSRLEAQIQERDKESIKTNGQGNCHNTTERSLKKFKRQKTETSNRAEVANNTKTEMAAKAKHDTQCTPSTNASEENGLVSWMSMDETQFFCFDKFKDSHSAADCNTDMSDDEDEDEEDYPNIDHKDKAFYTNLGTFIEHKKHNLHQNEISKYNERHDKKESTSSGKHKISEDCFTSGKEACPEGSRGILSHRKPLKIPFCPKEVKRILESEALLLKNAQTHTIRKIIVFASLGIKHGCEDMHELYFNHFSILRKGEPFLSPRDPGEHVLYENPGVRRKVFYPNPQNPMLCPVQVLEEEKAMGPSDPTCPSCLFLCIKYGGRTRNLPQNEYVRQRMGRNKMKSFGPIICRMAMLVHVRSGSFFFKALGITLLFMAGFPDDLVQNETKYRNLDLLQKYYRTDEDADGEELFLQHLTTCDSTTPGTRQITGKLATSTKPKGKKQLNSSHKPHNPLRSSVQQHGSPSSAHPIQFGMMSYASMNQVSTNSCTNAPYHNQIPYLTFPPQQPNSCVPMMYWPLPNFLFPRPYQTSFGFPSFPSPANYVPRHPQHYLNYPPSIPLVPKMAEESEKNEVVSDSDSSSSTTEPKEAIASSR